MSAFVEPGLEQRNERYDVCVVGGGMAGLCAAIASARNGAKTVLIHDRPVLGGNASSEVRMWVCGAHGQFNKETGIVEEIQLANAARNPAGNYSLWDSVLMEFARFTPGLTTHLNCSVNDAIMDGERIAAVKAWQGSTQIVYTIEATTFVDCSGDSILAPLTGALVRRGREARAEFDEDIQPEEADAKTMGNSLLLQLREHATPQPFTAPDWAYDFRDAGGLPRRIGNGFGHNFWWLELGGLSDTISETEDLNFELMRAGYGIFDYMKNHADTRDELTNWSLDWAGSTAGKRENRRYVGPFTMTQNDVRAEGKFDDVIAYGGWSMDDHHPAGLYYPGSPTIFHPAPAPYGIPYRTLYSDNVPNLLFAGRNISVTHAALSSTRVMATCAILGQAAGTAAALCHRHGCQPAALFPGRIAELQQTLMEDDCFLPGFAREASAETAAATLHGNDLVGALTTGHDRPRKGIPNCWEGNPGDAIEFRWNDAIPIGGLRLYLDSNLNDPKKMPCRYPIGATHYDMPGHLLRDISIEALDSDGAWAPVAAVRDNKRRLAEISIGKATTGLRISPKSTWGTDVLRIFGVDVINQRSWNPKLRAPVAKTRWVDIVGTLPDHALAAPATEQAERGKESSRVGA